MTSPLPANRDWYALSAVTPHTGKKETLLVSIPKDRVGMLRGGIHPVSIGDKTSTGYHCTFAVPMGVFSFGELCDLVDGRARHIRNILSESWEHMYSIVTLLEKVPEESISNRALLG